MTSSNRCQVFTPLDIANHMLDLAEYKGLLIGKKVLENSCGNGAILKQIVERYIFSCEKVGISKEKIKAGLENDIIAYEIDNELWHLAVTTVDRIAEQHGINGVRWKVYCKDSLFDEYSEAFDYVIGNPPYILYRDIAQIDQERVRKKFLSCRDGCFDYCYAFIEKSLNALKKDGKLVYLIPSSIFKNVFAKRLRTIMLRDLVCIEDYHQQHLFSGYLTSSAIIVSHRESNYSELMYHDVTGKNTKRIEKKKLGDKWVFSYSSILTEAEERRFGSFFSCSSVIATLYNAAYILDSFKISDDMVMSGNIAIELSATRKAASPRSFRYLKDERIIFPYEYDRTGSLKRFSDNSFQEKYPLAAKYLLSFKKELEKRDSDKNSSWFEYGRSQSLGRMNQKKLLISTLVTDKLYVYELDEETIPYAGIMITSIGRNSLNRAKRILESKEFLIYLKEIGTPASGRSLRITAKDIANYRVPEAVSGLYPS